MLPDLFKISYVVLEKRLIKEDTIKTTRKQSQSKCVQFMRVFKIPEEPLQASKHTTKIVEISFIAKPRE